MTRLYNRKAMQGRRRALRKGGTAAEGRLWLRLKNRQLHGRRFRRQFSVGAYVLDFYCPAERLAVELDGGIHADPARAAHDGERQRAIEALGIRIVRIPNGAVRDDLEGVAAFIAAHFATEDGSLRPSGTSSS